MCETTPTKVWQIALNCKFILQLEFILLIYYQSVFLYLKSFFTFLLKLFYFSSQIIQGTQFLFTHLTVIFFSIDYPGQIIKGFLFIWIVIICFPIRLLYWLLVFIKIYLIQWSLTVRLIVIVRFLVLFLFVRFSFHHNYYGIHYFSYHALMKFSCPSGFSHSFYFFIYSDLSPPSL